MCFYLENCSLKILRADTMLGVYYVHWEHSNAGKSKYIYLF